MRRRRVLIVSHVFPPLVAGGAPRMGQFARLLPEFGWDVTVVTAKHDGVDAAALKALDGRATIVESWSPSMMIKRGAPAPKRGARSWVRKTLRTAVMSVLFPDREIFWVPGAIAMGRRVLASTPHDVVLATHGPASNLVVGRTLASAAKLPLVVDFRDLWSTLPISTAFVSPLHRAAAHRLEGAIVRAASRVIAVAPNMATELASTHGVAGERAISITNGFDPDDLSRVHDSRTSGERPFRLMYLGTVNANYNLEPFWLAVKRLAEARRISPKTLRIEFVGNLAVSDVRAYGVDAFVDAKPFVAHAKVFDELARADALLMVETPGYYARYSYAAKVFDYLVTGKPVLALVEAGGNTALLLGDAGVGHVADPTDVGAIAGALESLLQLKGAAPRVVSSNNPPFAAFDRRNLVRTLAATLDDVATNEPHGSWS